MRVLKQSTTPTVMILMVDATDHVTGKTGLTITVTASKNGGAFASLDGSATVTEVSAGWYKIVLTANDTATIGDYALHATATGADPTDRLLCIESATLTEINTKTTNLPAFPAATGDAMTLTSAYDAAKTAGDQTTVTAIKAKTDQLVFADSKVNANAAVSLSAQDIQDIADGVIAQLPGAGSGDTAVDHNTGGTDALRVTTSGGIGVDNVTVTAYLKSDYLAGNTGLSAVRGNATTGPDGRWLTPIYLDAGFTYTLTFYKQGAYNTTTAEVTP